MRNSWSERLRPRHSMGRLLYGSTRTSQKNAYVYQDNQSAMRMEENGRMSAGSKSKHINNRHFWITDRVKSGELNIEYCPTELMLADFFTKPLQGSLFNKMRDVIMGKKHINSLRDELPPSAKERVENSMRSEYLRLRKKPKVGSAPHDEQEPPTPKNNTYADAVRRGMNNNNK